MSASNKLGFLAMLILMLNLRAKQCSNNTTCRAIVWLHEILRMPCHPGYRLDSRRVV